MQNVGSTGTFSVFDPPRDRITRCAAYARGERYSLPEKNEFRHSGKLLKNWILPLGLVLPVGFNLERSAMWKWPPSVGPKHWKLCFGHSCGHFHTYFTLCVIGLIRAKGWSSSKFCTFGTPSKAKITPRSYGSASHTHIDPRSLEAVNPWCKNPEK